MSTEQSAVSANFTLLFLFKTANPAPPSNLTLFSSAISWIPPFSLPGVAISYFVNVTNLNSSRVIRSGELRTPSFNFSAMKDGSSCNVYQITVTAKNKAGLSDPSNFTFSLPSCKLHLGNLTNHIKSAWKYKKSCIYNKHKDQPCSSIVASFPGHSHILFRICEEEFSPQLQDKIWGWPGNRG